jgi:propionyl-CoA synthetase
MSGYADVYAHWQADPEGFWAEAAQAIDWIRPWDRVYARVDGLDRWFVGAECNTCWNCLDRHVAGGRADQPALIYDSPITGGTKASYTYRELLGEVVA